MPVVDVLANQFVIGGGDVFAQQRQLRADGAAVGLALGRHPRIQAPALTAGLRPVDASAATESTCAAASSRN